MADSDNAISFVTFGMFIIDEIEWQTPNPPPPKTNLIGGAGTYAVLGARLAASPSLPLSRTISWIVDIGSDFPPEVKSTINTWNTDCVFRYDSQRLTTRAWNGYGANDLRAFKYLTPKVRLEVSSLNDGQIMAKSFHMVCSPDRCIDITTKLCEARKRIDPTCLDPVIVWEPIPDLCSPEQLSRLQEAGSNCTVISPNHEELKMFFPDEISETESQSELVVRLMGWHAHKTNPNSTRATSISSSPIVIIREGSNGSTTYIHDPSKTSLDPITIHLPAYHTPDMSSSVTDPTGGGNTYLGALAITLGLYATNTPDTIPLSKALSEYLTVESSLIKSNDLNPLTRTTTVLVHAMITALIAASFAIEQNGTPILNQNQKRSRDHNDIPSHIHSHTNISPSVAVPGGNGSHTNHDDQSQTGHPRNRDQDRDRDIDDSEEEKDEERWNGDTVEARTRRYLERERREVRSQLDKYM